MTRSTRVLLAAAFFCASAGRAPAQSYFAVLDGTGNITSTSEVAASNASVPDDGSCAGCIVITSDQYAAYQAQLAAPWQIATAYAGKIAGGLSITSSSTPQLNGTYPIDPTTQARINGEATYIQATSGWISSGTFTNGQTTKPWLDVSGAPHTFPTVLQFQSFAQAMARYVDALMTAEQTAIATNSAASWPSNSATIP